MPNDTIEPRPGRHWPAALGFWTALGVLESITAHVRAGVLGIPAGWQQVFVNNMPWWLLWGALTPAVAALVRRAPADPRRWPRVVFVHLAGAAAVCSAHLALEAVIFTWTSAWFTKTPPLSRQLTGFFLNYLMLDLVTYMVVAGACYAFEFYGRYRETELRSARLELGLSEARMHALRSELNPHFFFNALNAVSGLVRREENDAAVRMLARMAELLSATLDHDRGPEIPLREELALLDRYLDIERVRFGDRLKIDVDLDEGAAGALVPTFMLQPLVENAIRHGIAKRSGRSQIEVSARREAAGLVLAVRDTGEGVHPEPREGVGLSNTRARLGELYGKEASLVLENLPGGGACVRVTLPLRLEAAGHG
ncbi:MAG: sensor histidine kinase [Myxococcales bacterium]